MMSILDIAVGLVFTYVLLALMCTTLQEMIASALRSRARHLANGIANMLLDPERSRLARAFFAHPLVRTLAPDGKHPSYIAPATFANAIIDIAKRNGSLSAGDLNPVLAPLWSNAGGDIEKFRKDLETWFNEGMARVSGWYTRRSQLVSILIAAGLVVALNADSLSIARSLQTDAALRGAMVKQAEAFASANSAPLSNASCREGATNSEATCLADKLKVYQTELEGIGLRVGWRFPNTGEKILQETGCNTLFEVRICSNDGGPPLSLGRFAGWILTVLAVSLGAKFWFDVLQKLIQLRGSGAKPELQKPPVGTPDPTRPVTPPA